MTLPPDLLVAANRQVIRERVGRWLLHDLRNPTQALTLVAAMIAEEPSPDDPSIGEMLQETTARLSDGLELLDRVLAVSSFHQEPGPVALADSLGFVKALCHERHTGVTLDLTTAQADQLPAVRAVDHEVELVLLNLICNSVEALRGRPAGRIVVNTSHVGSHVHVAVEDDGPGVAPAVEASMFEPFVTGWSGADSAGLGLTVSRWLAERHGGGLSYVPSDDAAANGAGARFVLALPVMD